MQYIFIFVLPFRILKKVVSNSYIVKKVNAGDLATNHSQLKELK